MEDLESQSGAYDLAIAELVQQMDLKRRGLTELLGLKAPDVPSELEALLATPLAKDLQALTRFVKTGEGDRAAVQTTILAILSRLFAPPYFPEGLENISEGFWLQPGGELLAKALARVYAGDLITISEAAQLAGVSSPTVSIAVKQGNLTAYSDPAVKNPRWRRRVRRSQVLARWGASKFAPEENEEAWEVYERRVPEGHQVVVSYQAIILNQWVTCLGKSTSSNRAALPIGEGEAHDPRLGNPEWVGQSIALLKGRYFRHVSSREELQWLLLIHRSLIVGTSPG